MKTLSIPETWEQLRGLAQSLAKFAPEQYPQPRDSAMALCNNVMPDATNPCGQKQVDLWRAFDGTISSLQSLLRGDYDVKREEAVKAKRATDEMAFQRSLGSRFFTFPIFSVIRMMEPDMSVETLETFINGDKKFEPYSILVIAKDPLTGGPLVRVTGKGTISVENIDGRWQYLTEDEAMAFIDGIPEENRAGILATINDLFL